jgi:hypothetical protein
MTTELRGGASFLVSLLRNSLYSVRGAEQDIVLKDSPYGRELYREGPFNNLSVQRALRTIVAEIERTGLEGFLRRKRIENAQLGPVSVASGQSTFPFKDYLAAWLRTLRGRRRAKPDDR